MEELTNVRTLLGNRYVCSGELRLRAAIAHPCRDFSALWSKVLHLCVEIVITDGLSEQQLRTNYDHNDLHCALFDFALGQDHLCGGTGNAPKSRTTPKSFQGRCFHHQ